MSFVKVSKSGCWLWTGCTLDGYGRFQMPGKKLWVFSMGKKFRVRAITTTVDEANDVMKRHGNTALIACFGEFNIIANQYEGIRDEDRA